MWFSTAFDITWYVEAAIYVKNLFLIKKIFLSFYSFLLKFSE